MGYWHIGVSGFRVKVFMMWGCAGSSKHSGFRYVSNLGCFIPGYVADPTVFFGVHISVLASSSKPPKCLNLRAPRIVKRSALKP